MRSGWRQGDRSDLVWPEVPAKPLKRGPFMAIHLQRDLDRLQRDLVALAGLVEAALHKATRALCGRAAGWASEVIAADPQIDTEETQIDEDCLKILALHQP